MIDQIIKTAEMDFKGKGWSKSEFCEKIGVSTQRYNNWRSRGFPKSMLPTICSTLEWDLAILMSKGKVVRLAINDETNANTQKSSLLNSSAETEAALSPSKKVSLAGQRLSVISSEIEKLESERFQPQILKKAVLETEVLIAAKLEVDRTATTPMERALLTIELYEHLVKHGNTLTQEEKNQLDAIIEQEALNADKKA